ncbi:GIY-YIG nuclease family protein [Flavivirga aquimarina]|uniref:GIY-YIG nuclease family protein n=1 Tax=Flavivirga aquimarina TaxID=2027862 RepID=A0ABT8WD51_9FLAO|nr:GIY-YIG nuclease family protein [Flavivirga aquimarina]MDO5971080.1 GIY-YIG nuclease family protein [Flavivirga aquimarina]
MKQTHYCYILTNKNKTVLYIGYTNDLNRRISEHQNGKGVVFTKKYNVSYLLYYEKFENIKEAKSREKQLKNWHKEWKWNLIKNSNPKLETLSVK